MATAAKLMTAEEFALLPDDGTRQELVRGEVVSMPRPNWKHGEIAFNVAMAIKTYLRGNRIGRVSVEGGVIVERNPDTVRGPDVSFMSKERMPLDAEMDCYAEGAPDLCVEVLSPSNTPKKFNEKLSEYFTGGAKLVWVVDPDTRSVKAYSSAKKKRVIEADGTIDGGDVLPGFSCPVSEFFV
jgi:Uma2 family endonuclease